MAVLTLFAVCSTASDYVFRNMESSDGLSGLLVNTIYKDRYGYLWLGTDNGVDRFDGMRVKNYVFSGVGQTVGKRVNCVTVTQRGKLYVGNGLGLWQEDGLSGGALLVRAYADKVSSPVNALAADGDVVYAGTDNGLYIIGKDVRKAKVNANAWAESNRITDICDDAAGGCLWMTTGDGLARYDKKSGRIRLMRMKGKNDDNSFKCLTKLGQTLYVGTMTKGLLLFNTRTYTFSQGPSIGANVVSDISTDGRDMVYVATDGNGIHFISHSGRRVVRVYKHIQGNENSISSNSVYSLLVDDRGMIYVGTYRTGFDYTLYHSNLFTTYAFPPDFTSANLTVNRICIRGSERLIGTRDGLYYINEATRRCKHFTPPEITSDLILSTIFFDNRYFIGTYGGGLLTLDPNTLAVRRYGGSLSRGHVFCLKSDGMGNLWMGTSDGAYMLDGKTRQLRHFNTANSQIPSGNVYDITFDSQGKGWIGTETGLALYDPAKGSIMADVFPEGFVNKEKIRTIFEDSRHNLYFIREKGDVFMSSLSMDKFGDISLPFLRKDIDNYVLSMIEDRRHNMWLACSSGLFCMKTMGDKAFCMFTSNDGLPDQTFTNNSAFMDDSGRLWFGNTKGLVSVNPETMGAKYLKSLKRISITGVSVNGRETNDYSSLSNNDDNLTFFFSDMSYGAPGSSVYEYRLEGEDDDWRLAIACGQVSYYNLGAGTYTFHVRKPGNPMTEATVTVTVRPLVAWWGWGIIIAVLAAFVEYVRRLIKRRRQGDAVATEAVLTTVNAESKEDTETVKTTRAQLSEADCDEIKRRLTAYMQQQRPYVNKSLKSADVAAGINVPLNTLSYVLNQHVHVSFNDYINEYRVNEFKRKATDTHYAQLTLSALAEECGFGSHASFFRTFKKITGITPNEYLQKARKRE